MQLVAYGAQDIYLNNPNPRLTFFRTVYRRHTNFSVGTPSMKCLIPIRVFHKFKIKRIENNTECPVTYFDLLNSKYVTCVTCSYNFHISVYQDWIKQHKTCPHCCTEWKELHIEYIFINGRTRIQKFYFTYVDIELAENETFDEDTGTIIKDDTTNDISTDWITNYFDS